MYDFLRDANNRIYTLSAKWWFCRERYFLLELPRKPQVGTVPFLLLQQPGGGVVWSAGHQVAQPVNLV